MHRLASSYSERKITIIDLGPKPPDWVGKCWACFQGYQRSTGQVLLFTDADTIHTPDTISLAVRHVVDEDLDALTARPRITSDNTWTKIVLPLVWMVSHIVYSALKVNNPKSKTGFVFGGFYLITREVYESLGTHQSIKCEIAEDSGNRKKVETWRTPAQNVSWRREYPVLMGFRFQVPAWCNPADYSLSLSKTTHFDMCFCSVASCDASLALGNSSLFFLLPLLLFIPIADAHK